MTDLLTAAKALLEAYDELDMALGAYHAEAVEDLRFAVAQAEGGAK